MEAVTGALEARYGRGVRVMTVEERLILRVPVAPGSLAKQALAGMWGGGAWLVLPKAAAAKARKIAISAA